MTNFDAKIFYFQKTTNLRLMSHILKVEIILELILFLSSTSSKYLINCLPNCFYTIFQYFKNVYEGLSREHYIMLMNFKYILNFICGLICNASKMLWKHMNPFHATGLSLYTPPKHEKTPDFLIFLVGIERN